MVRALFAYQCRVGVERELGRGLRLEEVWAQGQGWVVEALEWHGLWKGQGRTRLGLQPPYQLLVAALCFQSEDLIILWVLLSAVMLCTLRSTATLELRYSGPTMARWCDTWAAVGAAVLGS